MAGFVIDYISWEAKKWAPGFIVIFFWASVGFGWVNDDRQGIYWMTYGPQGISFYFKEVGNNVYSELGIGICEGFNKIWIVCTCSHT